MTRFCSDYDLNDTSKAPCIIQLFDSTALKATTRKILTIPGDLNKDSDGVSWSAEQACTSEMLLTLILPPCFVRIVGNDLLVEGLHPWFAGEYKFTVLRDGAADKQV